ncbi:MAG TPA: polyribonucleotide nucleotidyltransferase [Spirochaetia bacterium]|nr:MAG: polyribonucleotide nucleotidyltransferase [Spirochaetes bacterium GWB1_36_13]HCL56084.1 polyribonucleotide nucleotidyltransferase [Spirochaetia bacterium]
MEQQVELEYRGKKLIIKTGKIAKQANGSVMVQYGNTVVFAPAVMGKDAMEDPGFFPLSVHYIEKFYAAGKIPGGFFKREGKPSDREVLTSRFIDRSLRPLFPEGFRNEVQILPMTLAADHENSPDILAVIASSAALTISDIPFGGPVGAVRVCLKNGEYIVNPTPQELDKSDLSVIVSGTKDGITMIEGGASFVSEEKMIQAVKEGYKVILEIIQLQEELRSKAGKAKKEVALFKRPESIDQEVREYAENLFQQALSVGQKQERAQAIEDTYKSIQKHFEEKYPEDKSVLKQVKEAAHDLEYDMVREKLFKDNQRVDGRKPDEIRLIAVETGVLPMVHGSSLFTRGETQSLGVLTLGSVSDQQRVDDIEGESSKRYMLHYNFPSFSVGETGRVGAPGRREVGHGYLAERALEAVIPNETEFPYTIRLVSEIMESNGSSSMATVCSGCLAMMDGGVPIKAPVAGIAMGLMFNKTKDAYKILTDIQGLEDHYGDMDFKVAGTLDGITAFQLDIKLDAISVDLLGEALEEAKKARFHILDKMTQVLAKPREEISDFAPKILIIMANPDNVRYLIGPGGKTIKKIVEETGVKIDIADNGEIKIVSSDIHKAQEVYERVLYYVRDIKVGDKIQGIVRRVVDFGAFIELAAGREGLCHISNLSSQRVRKVEDVLNEGDSVLVKVIGIDNAGKISISIKDL